MSAALGIKSIGIFTDSPAYSYSGYSKNIIPIVPREKQLKVQLMILWVKIRFLLKEVFEKTKKYFKLTKVGFYNFFFCFIY